MKKFVSVLFVSLALAACQQAAPDDGESAASSSSSSVDAMEESSSSAESSDTASEGGSLTVDYSLSSLTFTGQSNIVNHEGEFGDFTVTMTLDESDPSDFTKADISVDVDATSITADGTGVDGHLLRQDFFDVENHPRITFDSTAIASQGGDNFTVTGNMTVKGVTKAVTLDAVITEDEMNVSFQFPRQEFGVGNDSYGNKFLSPAVPVEGRIVFTR